MESQNKLMNAVLKNEPIQRGKPKYKKSKNQPRMIRAREMALMGFIYQYLDKLGYTRTKSVFLNETDECFHKKDEIMNVLIQNNKSLLSRHFGTETDTLLEMMICNFSEHTMRESKDVGTMTYGMGAESKSDQEWKVIEEIMEKKIHDSVQGFKAQNFGKLEKQVRKLCSMDYKRKIDRQEEVFLEQKNDYAAKLRRNGGFILRSTPLYIYIL